MPQSALIIGCGFVGVALARLFYSAGWEILGITASSESAAKLSGEPFPVAGMDITNREQVSTLAGRPFDIVVHCASSGRGGAKAYQKVFLEGTENLLAAGTARHYLFASSTSVYAQTDGGWVSEASETAPSRETGQILLQTEAAILRAGGAVGRLAGLYGPGRCVPLRKLLAGEAVIEGDGKRMMNMVHRDDAAGALFFLAGQGCSGIFNIVDDRPTTQLDWYTSVCRQMDKPLPPFGPYDLERKRGWTDKRVSNKKLRSLGWEPTYPTFLNGLLSC